MHTKCKKLVKQSLLYSPIGCLLYSLKVKAVLLQYFVRLDAATYTNMCSVMQLNKPILPRPMVEALQQRLTTSDAQ